MNIFKKNIFGVIMVLLYCFSAQGQEKHLSGIQHDTYIVGRRLPSKKAVDRTNFSNYNFMYLMTGPKWSEKDFDIKPSKIHKKLIARYQYPRGDSGEGLVPHLIDKAHEHGTKMMYCVGVEIGNPAKIGVGKSTFYAVAENDERKLNFERTVVGFMEKFNLEGIDIDWEHVADVNLHADLMQAIRGELNQLEKEKGRKYYLTTAMHTTIPFTKASVAKLIAQVDWVNFMTYDMGGGKWGKIAKHNTPLDLIEKRLNTLQKKGFPGDKISVGLANYGFVYRGIQPNIKVSGNLRDKGKYINWNQFKLLLFKGWQEVYDEKAQMSFYFSPHKKDFVTIDDTRSLANKLHWIKANNFGRVFWWEFHCDLLYTPTHEKHDVHELQDFVAGAIGQNE